MQIGSEIPARTHRPWLKVLLWTVVAISLSLSPALTLGTGEGSGNVAQIPPALDQLAQIEDLSVPEALRSFKQGVDHYLKERYGAALEMIPGDAAATAADIGDYALFYRGRANLMLDRGKEALDLFRLLENRYPNSSLTENALLGQCQALLKMKDPAAVLSILNDSRIQGDSETRYYEARALDLAGEKEKAIERYLDLHSGYPKSASSALAERNLLLLSPGALKGKRSYGIRLLRAESLLKANDARNARPLLLALGKVTSPDSASSQKRHLLLADAEYRLGRTSAALLQLRNVKATNPANHAKAIRLEGSCYRRLERESALLSQRDRALKLYPLSSETEELCYLAATYFDIKYESAKARQAYTILFEHFPKGRYAERALWKLALFAYFGKEYEEAASVFWNYLLAYPNATSAGSAMYWMGRCYERLGGPTNARYLYGKVQALANNSYLGQCALNAETAMGRSGVAASAVIPEIDFEKVVSACDGIRHIPVSLAEPGSAVVPVIERARRLWAADLTDLALADLRWAIRRFPGEEKPLSYIIARIYSSKENHLQAIAGLRNLYPNYTSRPLAELPPEVWQILFPTPHLNVIQERAAKSKLDPALIMGLIRQESAFNEKAKSPANARGLMQIVPATGSRLARQAGIKRYTANKLFQAETNIILGTNYLAYLLQRYGKLELALGAYNAGGSRVDLWLKKFGDVDMPEFVELIPFSETRGYVKQVLSNRALYGLLTSSAAPDN